MHVSRPKSKWVVVTVPTLHRSEAAAEKGAETYRRARPVWSDDVGSIAANQKSTRDAEGSSLHT